jgi:uncharacterized membrane protein
MDSDSAKVVGGAGAVIGIIAAVIVFIGFLLLVILLPLSFQTVRSFIDDDDNKSH